MTLYSKNVNSYIPTDENSFELLELLPVGNYIIKDNPLGPMYFEKVDGFEMPKKLYGDTAEKAERILNTFQTRKGTTGVLLSGEKGSGKTLLAKLLSINSGMPVIMVNSPYRGDKFSKLLQDLTQPAVILFDEFEKVYNDSDGEQDALLSLLDGVFTTKKLFVFTCNEIYKINNCMKNRPGRIFYSLEFKGLTVKFIEDYCQDNLNNKEHIDSVANLSLMFREFNFDMLTALCEEMNRYNEDPHQALKMLNIKTETWSSYGKFDVELEINGEKMVVTEPKKAQFDKNPLFEEYDNDFRIYACKEKKVSQAKNKKKNDPSDFEEYNERAVCYFFGKQDLKDINKSEETYTFVNSSGHKVVISKAKSNGNGYNNFF